MPRTVEDKLAADGIVIAIAEPSGLKRDAGLHLMAAHVVRERFVDGRIYIGEAPAVEITSPKCALIRL